MPHWRTFVSNEWFTAADLYDEKVEKFFDILVTITDVRGGEITGQGGRKSRKPVIKFKSARGTEYKPLVVNSTNAKAITQIAGSDDTKRWLNVTICLFVSKTRDPEGGGQINCVRIQPPPAPQPAPQPAPKGQP